MGDEVDQVIDALHERQSVTRRSNSILPGIQVLRAVAVLAVLLHHVLEESHDLIGPSGAPAWVVLLGASGVDVFFCISGFIMLQTNRERFKRPGAASDFLIRRAIRIVPLYWSCTVVVTALWVFGLAYRGALLTPSTVVRSLLFLPNDQVVVYVGWTLNYEAYFYVLFAVLLTFVARRTALIVLPIVLIGFILGGHLLPDGAIRHFLTDPIALEFWFGVVVAFTHDRMTTRSRRSDRWTLVIGTTGLVLGAVLGPASGTSGLAPEFRFAVWGMPAAALLWCAASATAITGPVGQVFTTLGNASYAIYLTHALVMPIYARLIKAGAMASLPASSSIALAIAVSLAIGTATHVAVERPADRWLRGVWRSSCFRRIASDDAVRA